MFQKPLIYVSRITNLSDARYCAGMGVDMLGFVIDPVHEDFVSAKSYQEMVGWIAGPKRVIEITSSFPSDWTETIDQYKPDLIHIPFTQLSTLKSLDIPVILEISFQDWKVSWSKFQSLPFTISHVMVTGFPDSISASDLPARQYPIILALKENETTVEVLLEKAEVEGIALMGSREQSPGLKDYDHLARILEELDELFED
jgi:phosphoribosylanthranilate isomerase